MASDMHPEDTLFLVHEADFRVHEHDCHVCPWAPYFPTPAKFLQQRGLDEERGTSYKATEPHEDLTWEEKQPVPPYIRDVVQLCTAAERVGHGNLVWYSWSSRTNGTPPEKKKDVKRKIFIASGMFAIAYSKKGAKYILEHLEGSALEKPDFMDQTLKRFLIDEGHAEAENWEPVSCTLPSGGSSTTFRETPQTRTSGVTGMIGPGARRDHMHDPTQEICTGPW